MSDGDGWTECTSGTALGAVRRGRAAGRRAPGGPYVLLQHRAPWSHGGDTWGVPGGARGPATRAPSRRPGARRSRRPAWTSRSSCVVGEHVADHGTWSYTTFVATVPERLPVVPERESVDLRWVARRRGDRAAAASGVRRGLAGAAARCCRERAPARAAGRSPSARPSCCSDLDADDGWLLSVDGVAQSYVDRGRPDPPRVRLRPADGRRRRLPRPRGGPLTAVHLGGGGCTLPRYVAATRPGSRQLVVEADEPLAELVRRSFGTARLPAAGRRRPHRAADAAPGRERPGRRRRVRERLQPMHVTTLEWVQRGAAAAAARRGVRRERRGRQAAGVRQGARCRRCWRRSRTSCCSPTRRCCAAAASPTSCSPPPTRRCRSTRSSAARRAPPGGRASSPATTCGDFTGGAAPVTDATARSAPRPPPELFRR